MGQNEIFVKSKCFSIVSMNLNPNREVLNAETPFYGICYQISFLYVLDGFTF